MNSKERVLTALNHEEADRVPLDLGGTNVTSIHREVEKRLEEYLGISDGRSEIISKKMGTVAPDERLLKYFGSDTRCLHLKESKEWEVRDDGIFIDEWGIGFRKSPDSCYYEFCYHPLGEAKKKDIHNYPWPDPFSKKRIEGLKDKAESYGNHYCIVLEGTREPIFGLATWLRGYERLLMDMIENRDFVEELFDTLLDFWEKCLGFVFSEIGEYIDVVKVADDLGAQNSLLISPQLYRELVKPRHEKLFRFIKENTNCRILLHCDGAIDEIIPDLIEIGIDALNPIQPTVKGMEPEILKKKYGDRLTFWGGGIDTQSTLVFASPEEVKNEVKRRVNILKKGGGFVFCQVHNIQPDVPLDNIIAMYEGFREVAYY